MAIPRIEVAAPTLRPSKFGLFSVAPPSNQNDGHWQAGSEWVSDACIVDLNYADALCTKTGFSEVQRLAITGTPTGGNYTLTFDGQTTSALAHNANAAAITAALVALSNVDSGDITATGTYPTFDFEFGGQYTFENVPLITVTPALTGGTAPTATVTLINDGEVTPKVVTESNGDVVTADPFAVYALRECRAVADWAAAADRATAMLVNGEERAVEAEVWARLAANADAVDITPGSGTITPEMGLAYLEAWMGDHYAGAPTIHVHRDVASILGTRQAIARHGNHLESVLGSYISAGNGYGTVGVDEDAPATGKRWMFASSTIEITRGVANVRGPFFVQDPLDNTQVVLAERVYTTGYECLPVGIQVTFP